MSEDQAKKREGVVKVRAIRYDDQAVSNAVDEAEQRDDDLFEKADTLRPPYPPEKLYQHFEDSNCLRQNVDAYATNIDGFGHRFNPIVDLNADDADQKIADLLLLERAQVDKATGLRPDPAKVKLPTPGEIEALRKELEIAIRVERLRLEAWFNYCCADTSFVTVRMRSRIDREVTGNAYWEVIRNKLGEITEIGHLKSASMRLRPLGKPVEVEVQVQTSPLTTVTQRRVKRFRSYVQAAEGRKVYFKEFGDPRIVSSKTGRAYDDMAAFEKARGEKRDEKEARPATEVLHFLVYAPGGGAYGVPRWIGNLQSVLGSRESEMANLAAFRDNLIPAMLVLIAGGTMGDEGQAAFEQALKDFREKRNRHGAIVIEATAPTEEGTVATGNGKVGIEVKPMADKQQDDALFQNYDEKNRDKIGEAFRAPRIVRGDTRDFNKSTSDAALRLFEEQVCAPERVEFDEVMNRKLLPALEVRYHTFVSNGLVLTDAELRSTIVKIMSDAGAWTVRELREFSASIFGRPLRQIKEEWADLPVPVLLQQLAKEAAAEGEGDEEAGGAAARAGARRAPGAGKGASPGGKTQPRAGQAASAGSRRGARKSSAAPLVDLAEGIRMERDAFIGAVYAGARAADDAAAGDNGVEVEAGADNAETVP